MSDWQEDLITTEAAGTLDGLFEERLRRTPEATAYKDFDKSAQRWVDRCWREVAAQVARSRMALAHEAFEHGERAAIQLPNSIEWIYFDQAVLGEGLVSVPLYTEDRPDNVAYILHDAAVRLLLVQNLTQWHKLAPALEANTTLHRVLVLRTPRAAEQKQAALAGDPLDLTYMEYELLRFFVEHRGRVWTREQLLSKVWGYDYAGETRTVDVHISELRRKLGEDGPPIETVKGVGYRLVPPARVRGLR